MSKVDYTSANVRQTLRRLSLPMMVLSILDYLGILVSLGWLIALSSEPNLPATLRICTSIVAILEATFGGLLSAVYIYANKYFGRKDDAVAQHLINIGFGIVLAAGISMATLGRLVANPLVGTFDVDPTTKSNVLVYLNVFWLGYVAVLTHIYGGLIAKMSGDIAVIVRFRIVTFITNLLATPLLILLADRYDFHPLQSVASAAILSRLVGLAVLMWQLSRRGVFSFRLGIDFRPRRVFTEWHALGKLAVAETINGFSLTLSFFLLFVVVSYYEQGTLAAVTIGQYVTGIAATVVLGVLGSLIPFTAQNAGARNLENISAGVRWMMTRVLGACLLLSVLYMLFVPYIAGLFTDDAQLLARTVTYVRITIVPWAFLMGSFAYIYAVVGVGDSKGTLVLTIWSLYLSNLMPMLLVLWLIGDSTVLAAYAEASAHMLTFVGCVAYYRWKEKRLAHEWSSSSTTVVAGATA